jgi:hypothetical protein
MGNYIINNGCVTGLVFAETEPVMEMIGTQKNTGKDDGNKKGKKQFILLDIFENCPAFRIKITHIFFQAYLFSQTHTKREFVSDPNSHKAARGAQKDGRQGKNAAAPKRGEITTRPRTSDHKGHYCCFHHIFYNRAFSIKSLDP